MEGTEEQPPVTVLEEKELRRVYNTLCDYHKKKRLKNAIAPRLERLEELRATLLGAHLESTSQGSRPTSGRQSSNLGSGRLRKSHSEEEDEAREREMAIGEIEELEAELANLKNQLEETETDENRKIGPNDLLEALRFLGLKGIAKKEVQDMIWEVDENLDQCVDWSEFMLMFQRNIFDKTGLEPSQLFHMVQFMMYDADNSGRVKLDDTLDMMYARYRSQHWKKVEELFPKNKESGGTEGGGSITYLEYLEHAERTQKEMFEEREREKKNSSKKADSSR